MFLLHLAVGFLFTKIVPQTSLLTRFAVVSIQPKQIASSIASWCVNEGFLVWILYFVMKTMSFFLWFFSSQARHSLALWAWRVSIFSFGGIFLRFVLFVQELEIH